MTMTTVHDQVSSTELSRAGVDWNGLEQRQRTVEKGRREGTVYRMRSGLSMPVQYMPRPKLRHVRAYSFGRLPAIVFPDGKS